MMATSRGFLLSENLHYFYVIYRHHRKGYLMMGYWGILGIVEGILRSNNIFVSQCPFFMFPFGLSGQKQ